MAWHSESGSIFAVDHGPTGMTQEKFRVGNDELNVVASGSNFGWPIEGGAWGGSQYTQPIRVWEESIAPSGLVSLPTGDANRAELVVSSLRGQALRWLTLRRETATWHVVQERILLQGDYGRLRLLAAGQDGSLYIGTSNSDGRGAARTTGDLVLRLVLGSSSQGAASQADVADRLSEPSAPK
jgi:quinoprotein glucose dehydrogenase